MLGLFRPGRGAIAPDQQSSTVRRALGWVNGLGNPKPSRHRRPRPAAFRVGTGSPATVQTHAQSARFAQKSQPRAPMPRCRNPATGFVPDRAGQSQSGERSFVFLPDLRSTILVYCFRSKASDSGLVGEYPNGFSRHAPWGAIGLPGEANTAMEFRCVGCRWCFIPRYPSAPPRPRPGPEVHPAQPTAPAGGPCPNSPPSRPLHDIPLFAFSLWLHPSETPGQVIAGKAAPPVGGIRR